ncbi:MAG: trypsin-like peptidase domain-containing protein [Thermoleophilia bacterium]
MIPRALRVPLVALAALLALAAPAAAAPPSDLSRDPLDRAALLALPSVYRLEVTIHVPWLRQRDGTRIRVRGDARTVVETGTAFGVAPGGWLATAGHVAAPDPEDVAALAYQRMQAFAQQPHGNADVAGWVERTGARAVGHRVVSIVATQADAGEGARGSRSYPALQVEATDAADLALVRIGAETAPALELDEAASIGTPILSVGFGRGSSLAPHAAPVSELEATPRRGRLNRSGTLQRGTPPRQVIVVTIPVQAGDSGAPVVDAEGNVRGVVIQRLAAGGGIAEKATELRQLMEEQGIEPGAGTAAEEFRTGMESLWRLDPSAAGTSFESALAAFPDHTLAGRERARAAALQTAGFDLGGDRSRGLLLGLGVVASLVALAFAAALLLGGRRGGPPPSGR